MIVFSMYYGRVTVCWGFLGQKYRVMASVVAWGLGDAAAVLVGKRYGTIHIESSMVEGRESLAGTFAIFLVSIVVVLGVLLIYISMTWPANVLVAVVTGAFSAAVELYTKGGLDTITCPFAAASTMMIMIHFLKVGNMREKSGERT